MSITIEQLRTELAPIKTQVDGIPLIHRSIEVLRQEVRALRAAFNDFADHDRKRQEIRFAPWQMALAGMTAAFFAAGIAFIKILG